MKGNEIVWVVRGSPRQARFVCEYPQPPACRVIQNGMERIVRLSEVISNEEYERRKFERKRAAVMDKCADVIAAWNAGHKTVGAIAEYTYLYHLAVYQKLKAAKRWGLIKE